MIYDHLKLLKRAAEYVKAAHDAAEARHDSYGEYYMDGAQYEIMCDTNDILEQIRVIECAA